MIDRRLNIPKLKSAMDEAGLSQAGVASKLKVSREAVSQWLKEKSLPRPNKLLQLGKLLDLPFKDLVLKEEANRPVVAFRKYRGTKVTDTHQDEARDMGRKLRNLVPFVPFDLGVLPPRLKEPRLEYDYVEEAAQRIRADMRLEPGAFIDARDLVRHFRSLQAVLIPVLWGNERGTDRHANATHVFLPESETTWVYLNLDTNLLDFKFWMAHELGHCLAPGETEEMEKFADAFAGALLFPREAAEALFEEITPKSVSQQVTAICRMATQRRIAPYTIAKQLDAYAGSVGKNKLTLGRSVHQASAAINKSFPLMSAHLLGASEDVAAADYRKKVVEFFDTPFFDMLGKYLQASKQGPGFVQSILDIPLLDARSLFDELA